MQLSSYEFIFAFQPIVVLLFFGANKKSPLIGKIILVIASVVFFSLNGKNMLICLALSILLNYLAVLVIKHFRVHNKLLLAIPVVINICALLWFKYINFAIVGISRLLDRNLEILDIILPLGISFYTFQQIAYLVATWRRDLKDNNLIDKEQLREELKKDISPVSDIRASRKYRSLCAFNMLAASLKEAGYEFV